MSKFNDLVDGILAVAVPVDTKMTLGRLALSLLERDRDDLIGRQWGDLTVDKIQRRFVKMVARAGKDDPISAEKITGIAINAMQIGVRAFNKAVKQFKAEGNAAFRKSINSCREEKQEKENLYFDDDKYWRRETDDCFHALSRPDALLDLKKNGYSGIPKFEGGTSPAEDELYKIQRENRVSYAGPFCGRPAGLHDNNGKKILATASPAFIKGAAGDASPLIELFNDFFGRSAGDPLWDKQSIIHCLWLKHARLAFKNIETHLPGHAVCYIGEPDIGKTLVQEVDTKCLGGRSADPAMWLQSKTTFNSDLWAAEHLIISDANLDEKIESRKVMRDRLKEIVANQIQPLHRKHRECLHLRPIWRVSLSANNDPDSAFILPPLDDSTADKLLYFRCYPPAKPFPTGTEEVRKAFFDSLINAIPAFVHLVDNLECPPELAKGRFGIKEFHHPEIIELLESLNQDGELGEIIESWLNARNPDEFERSIGAAALYEALRSHSETFVKVSKSPQHLGHQLRRLAKARGWRGRIIKIPVHKGETRSKVNEWIIKKEIKHE